MTAADPPDGAAAGGGQPSAETEAERLNRRIAELLQELRVALPGVQVLFAFLLTVPFSQRFEEATPFQEKVYFVTLLLTTLATALLIAPTAHHRLQSGMHQRPRILESANRLAVAGLTALALAMCGAVLLITDFLFAPVTAGVVTAATAILFIVVWYASPVRTRLRRGSA